jgi:3-oxoadipate enol-lactonase
MDQSGMVEVNGAKLYYEARGEGHPVVLMHAGIADSRMWDDQMEAFARRYRVIRYDHRGFGKSEVPAGPASLSEDLYGLLRALDVERAHLIGVSMSGGIAIDFTLTHPEMVSALVPVCPGVGGINLEPDEHEQALFAEVQAAAQAGDLRRAGEASVHVWVDGPGRTPDQVNPAVRERVRGMLGLLASRQAEQEKAEYRMLEPPAAQRLGEIHVPTLIIIGDQDISPVQKTVDRLAAEIPGARKAVIHGAAHVPNMERPDEFNRIVLEFLAGVA